VQIPRRALQNSESTSHVADAYINSLAKLDSSGCRSASPIADRAPTLSNTCCWAAHSRPEWRLPAISDDSLLPKPFATAKVPEPRAENSSNAPDGSGVGALQPLSHGGSPTKFCLKRAVERLAHPEDEPRGWNFDSSRLRLPAGCCWAYRNSPRQPILPELVSLGW